MSTKIKSTGSASSIEFSKEFSTADLYKQHKDKGMSDVDAIKEVSTAFDVFCKETKNNGYLIERYTELYNHKTVIIPLALSFITFAVSVVFSMLLDVLKDMGNNVNDNSNIFSIIIGAIIFLILSVSIIYTFRRIFKEMKTTYSPYDVFVLSYERKRLYEELTNRGYIVEPIKE